MAQEDRSSLALFGTEEKIARLLIRRHGLQPPIDVLALARKIADVAEERFPSDADGIVIGASAARLRPLILLNIDKPDTRKRFTIAHEIGHIAIPWHAGPIACHQAVRDPQEQTIYVESEMEANRFAAELLLPEEWVRQQIVLDGFDVERNLKRLASADVSDAVLVLRLSSVFPSDTAFVLVDAVGIVQVACKSSGMFDLPKVGSKVDLQSLDRKGRTLQQIDRGAKRLLVSRATTAPAPRVHPKDEDESVEELFKRVLTDVGLWDKRHRISGIIGSANSQYAWAGADAMYRETWHRLARDAEFPRLLEHPDFPSYLHAAIGRMQDRRKDP